MYITYNGTDYTTTEKAEVKSGGSYTMQINLDNTLGQVGSKYGTYEIVSTHGTGKFVSTKKEIVNGTVTSETQENLEFADYIDRFVTFEIVGDTLKVNALRSVSEFVYPTDAVRTGTKWVYHSAYVDPRSGGVPTKCYAGVLVRDSVSGEEILLYVDIIPDTRSIQLDTIHLSF